MRCILYVRVSTEEQAKHGHSLAAQEEDCRRRAAVLGYGEDQVLLIREEGVSGEAVDRPGLNRLRDLVAAGGVGHVVMTDPDRFARNLSLQLIVTDEIIRAGATLEFVNFEWRNTPEGRLFYSLRGAIAEYEKAKIRERTRRGRERMVKEGKLPADPRLYGYRWSAEQRRLEPCPDEYPVLQYIKELVLSGESAHGVCRQLAALGLPAPRGARWYPSTVWKVIHNPEYTGTYWTGKRGGFRRSLPLDPAWDEETAGRLAASLRTHRAGRARSGALLAGLLYCGCCGGTVRMGSRTTGGYRYYACNRKARVAYGPGRLRTGGCTGRYWPARPLEEAVWREVAALVARRPAAAFVANSAVEHVRQRSAAEQERRRERLLRLFLSGRIDETTFDREMAKLQEGAGAVRALADPAGADIAPARIRRLDEEGRRAVLRTAVWQIIAGPGSAVEIRTVFGAAE